MSTKTQQLHERKIATTSKALLLRSHEEWQAQPSSATWTYNSQDVLQLQACANRSGHIKFPSPSRCAFPTAPAVSRKQLRAAAAAPQVASQMVRTVAVAFNECNTRRPKHFSEKSLLVMRSVEKSKWEVSSQSRPG